ncbi:hypothetical protein LCGC14_1151210 [marine sediment metagenome]|uniref:Uncharacterized protein n=1 Tax=marine sediment metagenome TaxID=412755 RepID=A0A0F9Q101_9ZZZZ
MRTIKKEIKQSSSIHQEIRNASFVPLESYDTEKFKYNFWFKVIKYINDKFIALKTTCNKIIQKQQLWVQEVDFKAIRNDVSMWLTEALIEGFIINFVVWALMGWKFNLVTMLAWGFAVKQLLSIYWRLRKDGPNPTIPKKNE